ncbi:hypothetical protein JCM8202_001093 [Rhodotorula sphaerocarpa]
MALLLDRRSGRTVPSKLREVLPRPEAVPEGSGPVYVLEEPGDDALLSERWNASDPDSDDEVFQDALEDPPAPPRSVQLPDEILELIIREAQEHDGEEETLRACSLVSKDWSEPAQRLLFGETLSVFDATGANKLRGILEVKPAIREAGRRRLYSALRPLPVTSFTVYSSLWSLGRNSQGLGEHADLRELFRLLCSWSGLESLTMSGFSAYPRLLMPNAVPAHTFPTYQLVELHLISCELADATLLWLLGNSAASLKRLNISGCSGLTPETLANVFAAIGRTLETLIFSVDMDDLANASGSRSLSTDLIKPLVGLRTINLSTDSVFPEEILHELVALPYLEDISLSYPSFECRIVKDALAALPLENTWSTLYLDAWEAPDLWDETQRYEVLQLCVFRGVELVLNGLNAAEIEEDWYGEELREDWAVLEADAAEAPAAAAKAVPT